MSDKVKTRPFAVVVLAAGKGTRMYSEIPKVLHTIAGKAMICHVLSTVAPLQPAKVVVVVAPDMESVKMSARAMYPACQFAVQNGGKHGTAAAVLAAQEQLKDFAGDVLVLFGDTPLLTTKTLEHMLASLQSSNQPTLTVLAMQPKDPAEYGRLVLNSRHELEEIIEFKDASPVQKENPLCNSGVMAIKGEALFATLLPAVENKNAKQEYYLTDLVKIARAKGLHCVFSTAEESEVLGVNSRAQLAQAEAVMQGRLRKAAMEKGVSLVAPETVHLSYDTRLGTDVTVHPYVVFGTGVTVGNKSEIRAFSHIEGATIGEEVIIGPFARLRPGSELADHVHIGNFVEIKKSRLEEGSKVNHLSYIGDALVGSKSNIGAGTITCNYDGFEKHHTRIGAKVFVGSNTALVAPVTIGDGAVIGAGSVITEDVEADALALSRSPQKQRKDGAKEMRAKKSPKKVN